MDDEARRQVHPIIPDDPPPEWVGIDFDSIARKNRNSETSGVSGLGREKDVWALI
jgi:hypothetical protein